MKSYCPCRGLLLTDAVDGEPLYRHVLEYSKKPGSEGTAVPRAINA